MSANIIVITKHGNVPIKNVGKVRIEPDGLKVYRTDHDGYDIIMASFAVEEWVGWHTTGPTNPVSYYLKKLARKLQKPS